MLSVENRGRKCTSLLVLRSEGRELDGQGFSATISESSNRTPQGASGSGNEVFISARPMLEICRGKARGLSPLGRRYASRSDRP